MVGFLVPASIQYGKQKFVEWQQFQAGVYSKPIYFTEGDNKGGGLIFSVTNYLVKSNHI